MSQFSRVKLKKKRLPSLVCGMALAGLIGFSSCSTQSSEPEYIEETTVVDYTQGLITELEEVEKDLFKITDENVAPTKEDSRIIATYMDGAIDTFTLDEVTMTDAEDPNSDGYSRRSGMSSVLMGGMMGYFMGRSLSSPTNPSAYKNTAAYNKANTTTSSALKSTAKTTTTRTRKPSSGSSGHGSGRSTRSHGG